jgi:hypothetical protein
MTFLYVKRQHGHDVQVHLDSQQFGQSLVNEPGLQEEAATDTGTEGFFLAE